MVIFIGGYRSVKVVRQKMGLLLTLGLIFLGVTVTVYSEETEPSMMDLIQQAGYEVSENDRPASVILIDANTGKYLWGENPDVPRNPASIMKLMTLYMVYEAMAEGKLSLDTTVVATQRYQAISQIYALSNAPIVSGVEYPVRELIPMVLVPSSNVATLMLAELVEPSPVTFLQMMNTKAQELGMTQTRIQNATGAQISAFQELYVPAEMDSSALNPWEDNVTTARDLSILIYHLLQKYSEILAYTATAQYTVMAGTSYEETFDTYNYSLPGLRYAYAGVDGLKTGSSQTGGFNISMTAQRDDLRLITVVLGVGDWANQEGEYLRQPFANAALEYGFSQFEYQVVLKAGEHEINGQKVALVNDLYDTVRKDSDLSLQVSKDVVRLNHALPTVSEVIPQRTQGITVVSSPEKRVKKVTQKMAPSSLSGESRLAIFSGVGVFMIIAVVIVVHNIKTTQKRRRARQNRGKRERKNQR